MHIIIAPQALKGSLSAVEAGVAIAQGVQANDPDATTSIVPIADGGEGTVQALVDATGGQIIQQTVTGPLGTPVEAFYGLLGDGETTVIEMAAASGLPLLSPEQRDPARATTYGVGELIISALNQGRRRFIIGIGGSATNDGGAGMAQALGAHLLSNTGIELERGGAALHSLERIDAATLDARLQECTFRVACDVTNPLCGPNGATAVYGPQKGVTPEMVPLLDQALWHYAALLERDMGASVLNLPGSGAAGGMGAGLVAFLHAQLQAGAQIVLESTGLEHHLRDADLLITAEGRIDRQTAYGKSITAVAQLAKRYHLPVLAIAGGLDSGYEELYALGVDAIAVLPNGPISLSDAMSHAADLLRDSTRRALKLLYLGRMLAASQKSIQNF